MGKRFGAPTANWAQHTSMTRQLQVGQCAVNTALNTTYNARPDVVPYVGIMFSIFSKNPLDILTMELDIRFGSTMDLSVEVYTYAGRYDLVFNDPSVWTMLANTTAVPAPEGTGAIIPVNDFETVSMGRMERRSFYISMKSPILDYNVGALAKTNEVALQTPDMDLLVGVGFSEYKFPEAIDPLVDPQFTGVIHYARKATCGQVSTSVEYLFILDEQLRIEVLGNLTRFVGAAVTDIMLQDSGLRVFQEMHGLQKDGDAQTTPEPYPGTCPPEWDTCSLLLRTTVDFIHDESLRSGELIYSLYKFADAITATVGQQIPKVQVRYIGPRDVAAKFAITLNGVPKGVTMNAVQQEYFADVTVDFLSASSSGNSVLDLQVNEQIDNDGSIQVTGKLLGASFRPAATYVKGLESAFREGRELYIQKLFLNKLRPHAINDKGGMEFFDGIVSIGGRVGIDSDAPTPAPIWTQDQEDGGGDSPILIISIAAAVGALVLIILACWCRRTRVISRKEIERRRALRQEVKEKLLGHDEEDLEQTQGFVETVPHSTEGRLTILAGDTDYVEASAPLQLISEDSSSTSVTNSCDGGSRSGETTADHNTRRIPAYEETKQERQQHLTAAVRVKSAKVDEDASTSSQHRRHPVRASNSFEGDSTGAPPKKRSPLKTTKSLDGNEFSAELGIDRAPQKSGTASDEAPTSTGASTAALARFMKTERKSSANWKSRSRSIMSQSREVLGDMFRNLKEAEDADNAPQINQRTRPQFRASKSFEDDFRVGPPRRRAPPKATQSPEGNEFSAELGINRAPNKPGTALPEAQAKQEREQNLTAAVREKSAKVDEDASSSSQRRRSQLRASKSFYDDSTGIPPHRRAPLKATKSLDGNEFSAELGIDRAFQKSGKSAKVDEDASSGRLRRRSAKKTESSGSVRYQPPTAFGERVRRVEEAEHCPLGSQMKSTQLGVSKLSGDDSPAVSPRRSVPPNSTKSMDGNEFSNAQVLTSKLCGDSSPGVFPRRCAPLKSTKSLDRNEFTRELGRNRVSSLDKIDDGDVNLGTASNTPASAKLKSPPSAVPPKLSANTMKSSRSVQLKPIIDKITPAGPPRRRAPPKSTKSLDGNEFTGQLGHNGVTDKFDEGSDKRGTASNVPAPAGIKGCPPVASRKRMLPKPSKSLDANAFKRKLVHYTIPYLASKIDNDGPNNAFKTLTMVDTGPQSESSGDNTGPGRPQRRRAPPQSTKSSDGNEFTSQLGRHRVSHQCSTVSEAPSPIGASPAALARFMKTQPKSSNNRMSGSRSVQYQPGTVLVDMSRKMREAEDAPQDSHQDTAQLRASKLSKEDLPNWPPLKRQPSPKATKSLDKNAFKSNFVPSVPLEDDPPRSNKRGTASNDPASAKVKGFPPAA